MKKELQNTVAHLKQGNVILYPTDTIWGLGCDPYNQDAVDQIFTIKKREKSKPLIVLVDTLERLRGLVPKIHPHLENILHYNERPLTIIFPSSVRKWSEGITAENGSIAIRIVQNDFCKSIIKATDRPLVSTSANISDDPFPLSFDDIHPRIKDAVDYIVSPQLEEQRDEVMPSLIARYSTKQKELVFLR